MVSLSDATGASVAAYSYDAWGALTSSSEAFPGGANGWSNPYRYDGRDGTRYDTSDGLYWLSARVYDPTKRSAGREHGADVRNVGIHSAWPQVAATPPSDASSRTRTLPMLLEHSSLQSFPDCSDSGVVSPSRLRAIQCRPLAVIYW